LPSRWCKEFARPGFFGWSWASTLCRQIAFWSPVRPAHAEKSGPPVEVALPSFSFESGATPPPRPSSFGPGVAVSEGSGEADGSSDSDGTGLGPLEGTIDGLGAGVGASDGLGTPVGDGRTPGTALATVPPTITAAIA
jgi:hypothetical protein